MSGELDENGLEATIRRLRDYAMDAEAKKWWLKFCEAQQDLNAAEARIKALEGVSDARVEAALSSWFANTAQGWHAAMEAAIRAYLAALKGDKP